MNSLPASGRSTLLATVLVGLAVWITPLQAHSASGNQGTNEIRIVELQGTVEISPAGTQRWFLTQTNQILRPSDKLRTGPHSTRVHPTFSSTGWRCSSPKGTPRARRS